MSQAWDFQVRKKSLRETRCVALEAPEDVALEEGEILVAVERFGFSANNVTYAVFGETLSYWDFFPAPSGWGHVPVWGTARVLRSRLPEIAGGERVYGYLPMASWLRLRPVRVHGRSFSDGSDHRRHLHPVYNSYERIVESPDGRTEARRMLLRPLFATAFLLDHFLADASFFGAEQLVLTSASSKTAVALAWMLARRSARPRVVGLTAADRAEFCRGLGTFDDVVAYEDLERAIPPVATASVDFAGNGRVLRRIHEHLEDRLGYSCLVGGTHWEARAGAGAMPGPHPELFFSPAHIKNRIDEWGRSDYEDRVEAAWQGFGAHLDGWLELRFEQGPEAVEQAYGAILEGRDHPAHGWILSLDGS